MKNKAFTLIELLAVIVVLAIILMLVVPNIIKSYNNGKKDLYNIMIKNICSSAKSYFDEYKEGVITPDSEICSVSNDLENCEIEITELIKKKYINSSIENPKTEEEIESGKIYIREASGVKDDNGLPMYIFSVEIDEEISDCN